MPVTLIPIAPDALAGLQAGDESALERIFRDHYTVLTREAMEVLEDGPASARTVESAFVRIWKDRARFGTPEELETFLHKCVHDGAVVRQSRRAVMHNFDTNPGAHAHRAPPSKEVPPVDDSWAHVVAALHASAPDAAAISHELADHSRHEAAEHLAAIAKGPPWKAIAGIVVALLIIGAGVVWLLDRVSNDSAVVGAINSPQARTLGTRPGQQAELTLTDGSTVRLGGDSRVRVPPRFGVELRSLRLDGTGTFTVARGQSREFDVRAKNASIRATGTAFTVRAYPDDSTVTVRVKDGGVTVYAGKDKRAVDAGKALVVAANGTLREPSPQELAQALAWTDGTFSVSNQPLRDVLPQVTRWYGIELRTHDSAILNRPVTMKAPLTSIREAIEGIEKSAGVVFGYEGKAMMLYDSANAPKGAKPGAPAKAGAPTKARAR